jgi:type IV pilus assembly protein PilC
MAFRYLAIGPDGRQVHGALDVASEEHAERALWDANYTVVSIRPVRKLPAIEQVFPSLFAVKKRALITFSRQLATLLEAGVPVMRSLELLEQQAGGGALAHAIRGIARSIRGGSTFADAVREHPAVFPPLYGRLVELGERTGQIEEMLRQIATYMEREEAVISRVRSALAYPTFVIALAFVVVGVLMTTALPALVQLFGEFNGDLPITTRILIGTTNFTTAYGMELVLLAGALIVGGAWFFKRPEGKELIDRLVLRAPVLRDVVINANAARFSRTLAMLLRAGLPLTEIMELVVRTTDNSVLRKEVEGVQQRLLDGEGLSAPMQSAGQYPQMLVQMVAVGEETGTLDANLEITAEFYTREVDQKVDALTGMLTPALTIVVGLIVAFVALSLVMPMYQLVGDINEASGGAGPPP